MKTKLFTIKDKQMGYGNIFEMPTEGAAIRDFGQNVMRPAPDGRINMMAEHPNDYCLVIIGEYDNDTGVIKPCTPKIIAEASQYITNKQ